MDNFYISRLTTELGTFRLQGRYLTAPLSSIFVTAKRKKTNEREICQHEISQLDIAQIDMLGTDGWFTLDQTIHEVVALTDKLQNTIKHHLTTKYLQGI